MASKLNVKTSLGVATIDLYKRLEKKLMVKDGAS
jgi:hypothetical protein